MKKTFYRFIFVILIGICFCKSAFAICPICTIVVGAGVGLSRWLGIDDTITGLWIGGLIMSLILWTIVWFEAKKMIFWGSNLLIVVFYYVLIVVPLYYADVVGHPLNRLWGVDKLLLGIVLGSTIFLSNSLWYFYLKKKNNGHAYFPFQKVVMPVVPLLVLSFLFYFLTR